MGFPTLAKDITLLILYFFIWPYELIDTPIWLILVYGLCWKSDFIDPVIISLVIIKIGLKFKLWSTHLNHLVPWTKTDLASRCFYKVHFVNFASLEYVFCLNSVIFSLVFVSGHYPIHRLHLIFQYDIHRRQVWLLWECFLSWKNPNIIALLVFEHHFSSMPLLFNAYDWYWPAYLDYHG